MEKNNLPNGLISVEDAIKLINSHERKNATVDMKFLVGNLPWLSKGKTYTIKLERHENGRIVKNGVVTTFLKNDYEVSILHHAITEHYRELSGREIDEDKLFTRHITTAIDDEKNPTGRPMRNRSASTKVGDSIESGERIVEE